MGCGSPTLRASPSGAPSREKRGKLRGLGISNTHRARRQRSASRAPRCASTAPARVTLFSGSMTQGQGHETVFKQLVCDRLGVHPDEVHYVQGDTDKVFFGEGTGGSRSATHRAARRSIGAMEKIVDKAQAHRGASARRRCRRRQLRRGDLLQPQDQPHADHAGCRARGRRSRTSCPQGMEARPGRHLGLQGGGRELSERLPCLRGGDRSATPARSQIVRYTRGRRCRHRAQSDAAARADPRRRRAGRRTDPDGGHPLRRRRASR